MEKNKRYAFVVLNWNGKKDTCLCIDSLDKISYQYDFDIIVVDNGSTDGSQNYIRNHINKNIKRRVKFIELSTNTGFTGGHIEGLKHTDANIICLLNNDAVVSENILSEADTIIKNVGEKFGAIGGRAYFWNKQQKAFDVWNEFFTYQKIDPVTATAYTIKGDPGESLAPKIVDNVSGACVFVNREAINTAGYLDDKFFAYYEETDMFARFKRVGYEIYYCPTIRYWHRFEPSEGSHGASSKHLKNFSTTLINRNQFIFAFKNFESKYLFRFLVWYYLRFISSILKLFTPSNRVMSMIIIKTTLKNLLIIPNLTKDRHYLAQNLPQVIGYNTKLILEAQRKTVIFLDIPPVNTLEFLLENTNDNDRVHLRRSKKCMVDFNHRCMQLNTEKSLLYSIAAAVSRTDIMLVIEGEDVELSQIKKEFARLNSTQPYILKRRGLFVFNRSYVYQIASHDLKLHERVDWAQKPILERRSIQIVRKLSLKIMGKPLKLASLVLNYLLYRKETGGYKGLLRAGLGLLKGAPTQPNRMLALMRAGAHEHRLLRRRSKEEDLSSNESLGNFPVANIPVFINCRDRVEALKQTIASLMDAGLSQIYLIDNQSSYKDLLDYYNTTRHQVILLGENMGHKAPWESLAVKLISGGNPYIVTDPDVVLSKHYTSETIEQMLLLFDKYPGYVKIGAGLAIEDLPDHYEHKNTVQKWEQQFWSIKLENTGNLEAYDAEIDTTFALYRPNLGYITLPSIRLGGNYTAKHLPWYQNSNKPTNEEKYYREHASSAVNTWDKDTLPEYLKDYIG